MRLLLLITFSTLFSLTAFSQCKYEKNEVDSFTGNKTIITQAKGLKFGLLDGAAIKLARMNDSKKLLWFYFTTSDIFSVRSGDKLMFKLDNDEVVTLSNLSRVTADYIITSGITSWSAKMTYELSPRVISLLSTHDIQSFRLYTSKGYLENDIKSKKKRSNLRSIIDCI